jgi:hypothetical protein
MSRRIVAGLILTVAVVSLFAWQQLGPQGRHEAEQPTQPKTASPSAATSPLVTLDPNGIDGIRLRKGNLYLQVRRRDSVWTGARDPKLLDAFLENLLDMVATPGFSVPPEDLADFGLNPPFGSIELIRLDGPTVVVLVGSRNPSETGTYAQVGRPGAVLLTSASLRSEFERAIRSITFTSPQDHEVGSVEDTPARYLDRS